VTTDAGGIPDIVTDGETGFVVTVGDHQTLAARAIQLLSDHNTATTMARQARAECMKYTWEVVCEQWLKLYRSVVQKNS
jgi:glycosyltransferase involved in cell wall biosynthesis